ALEGGVVLVLAHPQLEARVEERPEDLVEHGEHALVGERSAVDDVLLALGHEAARDAIRERSEGIVADDQVGAVLDGDVDVRRAAHASIDVVDALYGPGLFTAGQ